MQMNTAREYNILGPFFINHPNVRACNTIPGISDHYMVVAVDIELKPHYNRPKRREIFNYKTANLEEMRTSISTRGEEIIERNEHVEGKRQKFKSYINEIVNQYVRKGLTSKRHN